MKLVVQLNGFAWVLMAGLMIVPILVDPGGAGLFGLSGLLAATVGGGLILAGSGGRRTLRAREIFVMTTSVWISAAAAGALPLVFSGITPTDAFFESMSGITTTGSTVLTGLDQMARGLLIWRSLLQWIGGLGIIVTAIAILPIVRVGGMQIFRSESSDTAEKELASAAQFAAATFWIYFALTGLCMVAYLAGGMSEFDAVAHAMTTLATGGYSTHDASFGHFEGAFIQWAGTVFMLSGSLPFVWYLRVYTRGTVRSEQVWKYLSGLAIVIGILTIGLVLAEGLAPTEALRLVAFNVVSVVTTTGYASTDYTLWGETFIAVFFVLTFLGGCTGSTSGGVKAMRLILTVKAIALQVRRIHLPHIAATARFEGKAIEYDVFSGVVSFLAAFALICSVATILLNMMGLDLVTSLSAAATALANVGPGLGPVVGPAGNFASLPAEAKWLLALVMLMGRLEVLTVLVLLVPGVWRAW